MNIGIDARIYGIEHMGIGRYTECLISHLAKIKNNNRYTLFMLPEIAEKVNLDKGKFNIISVKAKPYTLKEHFVMPAVITKSKVDKMHWTHLNVSYYCPVPYVVTIHDLIMLHFPNSRATNLPNWKYKLKFLAYHKVLKNAVKKSKKIIAVSEYTKRDIVRHLNVNENKITVTHPGVENMILGTNTMANSPQFDSMLSQRYGITKQYILYVGSSYPHKNLNQLIRSFVELRTRYNRKYQLVLVGKIDLFYNRLKEYVEKNVIDKNIKSDIIFTGLVVDKELDGIYRSSKIFVFPSIYEGFGMPPLEAASRGIPVVCSRSSSVPEVMGDAVYYFDPKDPETLARALDKVGGSHKIKDELIRRGLKRSKHFSWERTAAQTSVLYESW